MEGSYFTNAWRRNENLADLQSLKIFYNLIQELGQHNVIRRGNAVVRAVR